MAEYSESTRGGVFRHRRAGLRDVCRMASQLDRAGDRASVATPMLAEICVRTNTASRIAIRLGLKKAFPGNLSVRTRPWWRLVNSRLKAIVMVNPMFKKIAHSFHEHILYTLLLPICIVLVGCRSQLSSSISDDATNGKPDMITGSLQINTNSLQFCNVDIIDEDIDELNTNDFSPAYRILRKIIVSNNIILVTNSFLLDIKECSSAFISSNLNNYFMTGPVSNDTIEGWCLDFGDLWTIGEWTIGGNQNVVTACFSRFSGEVHVVFKKTDDGYILTDVQRFEVQY